MFGTDTTQFVFPIRCYETSSFILTSLVDKGCVQSYARCRQRYEHTFKVNWIWDVVNFIFPCEIVTWIHRLSTILFPIFRSDICIGDVCSKKPFYFSLTNPKFDFWSLLKYLENIITMHQFFFFRNILLCQFPHLNKCNLSTCIFLQTTVHWSLLKFCIPWTKCWNLFKML